MPSESSKARKLSAFAAGFLIAFTVFSLNSGVMSQFYVPVSDALGVTRTAFAFYSTALTLATMISSPFIGKLLQQRKVPTVFIVFVSGLIVSVGFILYGFCTNLTQFYALSFIRGLATPGISTIPATMIINEHFTKGRATVTSIVFMGSSIGGAIFSQIVAYFLGRGGWTMAYFGMGGIALVLVLLLSVLYGPEKKKEVDASGHVVTVAPPGFLLQEIVKTPPFWAVCVGMTLFCVVVMGTQQHILAALVSVGYSDTYAASIYSIYMISMAGGKLFIGWFLDKFGTVAGILYNGFFLIASLVAFLFIASVGVAPYFVAVLFGLGNITATVLISFVVSNVYGLKDYGTIFGFIQFFMTAGFTAGVLISSMAYDVTGTYNAAWILYSVFTAVATGLLIFGVKRQGHFPEDAPQPVVAD